MKSTARFLFALACLALPAHAQDAEKTPPAKPVPVIYTMLPERSSLRFDAAQNGTMVGGEFRKFTTEILFHPENAEASHVKVVVDMASLFSQAQEMMENLPGKEWFATQEFAQAVFESKSIIMASPGHYIVDGMLTLKGKTKPVTLNFMYEPTGDNSVVVLGAGTLKRNDFGVGEGDWAKTDMVKDDVVVKFRIEAVQQVP